MERPSPAGSRKPSASSSVSSLSTLLPANHPRGLPASASCSPSLSPTAAGSGSSGAFFPSSPSFASSPPISAVSWIPNHLTSHCLSCNAEFRFLKRRHHCRRCGLIFCEDCSSRRVSLPGLGGGAAVRVCDKCYEQIKRERRDSLGRGGAPAAADGAPQRPPVMEVRNGVMVAPRSSSSSSSSNGRSRDDSSASATGRAAAYSHRRSVPFTPAISTAAAASTPAARSRAAAEAYWRRHIRIDDAESVKLHLSEVIVLIGRLEDLEAMTEDDINRRVRERRERWRDAHDKSAAAAAEGDKKASAAAAAAAAPAAYNARTWTGPALAVASLPPPSLSAGPASSASSRSASPLPARSPSPRVSVSSHNAVSSSSSNSASSTASTSPSHASAGPAAVSGCCRLHDQVQFSDFHLLAVHQQ